MVQVWNGYSDFLRINRNPAHSVADHYSFQIFLKITQTCLLVISYYSFFSDEDYSKRWTLRKSEKFRYQSASVLVAWARCLCGGCCLVLFIRKSSPIFQSLVLLYVAQQLDLEVVLYIPCLKTHERGRGRGGGGVGGRHRQIESATQKKTDCQTLKQPDRHEALTILARGFGFFSFSFPRLDKWSNDRWKKCNR